MKNRNLKSLVIFLVMANAVVFAQEVQNVQEKADATQTEATQAQVDATQSTLTSQEKATEKMVLTVDDAVSYAIENNKSLKSAAIDLELKKRASSYSWNTFLPGVQLSITGQRSNDIDSTLNSTNTTLGLVNQAYGTSYDLYSDEEKLYWAAVGNLGFSWNFNLAMIESIRAAKASYESGEISYDQSLKTTVTNVRKLFYGLLLQQENLKIQMDKLSNAQARYEQANKNYRAGLVPELSVLNSQVTYENQKPTVLSAELALRQQMSTFVFLLGLPFGTEIELSGSIDVDYVQLDAEELVSKYLQDNDDVRSLKKNIDLLNISLRASRLSTFTPSLALSFSCQPIFYSWGESYSLGDATDNGSLSLTLVYSNLIDMLPFSSNMQNIKDTKQQIAQAEIGLEQIEQNAEMEIHTLVDNLYTSQANIEAMERNVALAQKAYDSTLRAYNNGTQELLEVRDSEDSLNQARLGLSNEKYNYISNLLDLEDKLNIKLH